MVDGSFDPLHPGHLAYFRAARSLGYPLLCNICPDSETVKKHPILLPAADRAEILSSIDGLTYVHVSDVPTVEVLRELRPKFYAKGPDWKGRLPDEQVTACSNHGIGIVYTKTALASSTAILRACQPDVDAFERFVFSQHPAEKPWEPTAAVPYDFESRKAAEGKHPQLIKDVFQPKRVLDVGCGPGHLVRLLRDLDVSAMGWDKTPQKREHNHRWFREYDLTYQVDSDSGRCYDLVVCREVLEHLPVREIAVAVRSLCDLSERFCYITSRFTQARHFLDFADHDDLDPTHITIMPQDWLRHLFVLEGFRRRADLEARMDWKGLGRVLVYERA